MSAPTSSGDSSGRPPLPPDRDVTASEIGAYAYCAKAWHLERVLRAAPTADSARRRAAGVARHRAHGSRVRTLGVAGRALAWTAAILLALAALLAVAALAVGR